MFFLVYVSSATVMLSHCELVELLAQSRESSGNLGITGMLLYKNGCFMGVLEGSEPAVLQRHAEIMADVRNTGNMVLLQGNRDVRRYPDWSMAFPDQRTPQTDTLPGYSHFLNTPYDAHEFSQNPADCQRLLLSFKENMR